MASACGGSVNVAPSAVLGGAWTLRSIETPALGLVAPASSASYTVAFQEGGKLSVRADCNQCAGTYAISGDSLQVGALACTKAFCGASSYDAAFLDVLSNAATFGVRGIELSIESPRGTLRLIQ